jgi:hypothetical protein
MPDVSNESISASVRTIGGEQADQDRLRPAFDIIQ